MLWFLAFIAGVVSTFTVVAFGTPALILPLAVLIWASLGRRLVKFGGATFGAGVLILTLFSLVAVRCAEFNQIPNPTMLQTCSPPDALNPATAVGATLTIIGILATVAGRARALRFQPT